MPHRDWQSVLRSALLACGLLLPAGAGLAQPRQVASLNLCTDQLLLALADHGQIASLSRLARDPEISFLAERAQGMPTNEGAEPLLFRRPDLVLTGTYGQNDQVAILRKQGLEVLQLGPWSSLEEGRAQIRTLAARLGHPERGEALVARIDAALARTRGIVRGSRRVLVYERGGWVAATSSPLSEILAHLGFTLHQPALGLDAGGLARLEAVVMAPPDALLVDSAAQQAIDNSTALLAHPALAAAVPPERRLAVPARLTICGGPSTPAAIEALAEEARGKLR